MRNEFCKINQCFKNLYKYTKIKEKKYAFNMRFNYQLSYAIITFFLFLQNEC